MKKKFNKKNKKAKIASQTRKKHQNKIGKFDMASIKKEIEQELKGGKIKSHEAEIKEQRAPALHAIKNLK